jgi:hypothetical protein
MVPVVDEFGRKEERDDRRPRERVEIEQPVIVGKQKRYGDEPGLQGPHHVLPERNAE